MANLTNLTGLEMCLVGAPSCAFKGMALCRSLYNYRIFEIIDGKYIA